ncbi:MAG: hypothetical protein ACRC80_30025 [Waterburya sp.]
MYDFYFLAPVDTYNGLTAADCGVTAVPNDPANIGNIMPLCKTEALLQSAAAARRKLRIKVGTRYKYKSLIVAQEKADTFNQAVLGKDIAGGKVETVVTPLSASYS